MVKMQIHEGGRCDFIENLRKRQVRVGVEIGTYNGENATVLCNAVPTLEILYCIDPYQTDIEGYNDFVNDPQLVQECRASLIQALIDAKCIRGELFRCSSREAIGIISTKPLVDFVYIDANHDLDHVREDIALWSSRVRVGGIIAGHDFGHGYLGSVVPAVMEFTEKNSLYLHVFKQDDIWCCIK